MRRIVVLAAVSLFASSCHPRDMIMRKVMTDNADYFDAPDMQGSALEKVTDGVWSFRWTWYRNLVVETADGLVVTDPFNDEAATAMAAALAKQFPGKPIHTLIYSHYHLDHAMGGTKLPKPANVIAHQRCQWYWDDVGAKGILPVTMPIDGDQIMTVGGVEIRLVHLGKSHTDTNYAVFLPAQRVLWTADTALIRAWPPFGLPDLYAPGYEDALAKLGALSFDHYVPSHFGKGTRKDFDESVEFWHFNRSLAKEALAKLGPPNDKQKLGAYFDFMYPTVKKKYGHYRGFDDMALQLMIRNISGEMLGY